MLGPTVERLRSSLAFKLALLVLASTGVIFAAAFFYTTAVARRALLKSVHENVRNIARDTVRQMESVLNGVEPLPRMMAERLGHSNPNREQIQEIIRETLRSSPHVYGSAVAFEPGAFAPDVKSFSPYLYSKEGGFGSVDLGLGSYDYFSQDWYLIPKELGRPIWTEPYFDEGGGNSLMCTYSVPFFREKDGRRALAGVVTADVKADHLTRLVSAIKLYQSGYAFLNSKNGQIIAHPNPDWVCKESIFSVAEESGDAGLRDVGLRMARGEEGFVRRPSMVTGRMSWLYYAPIPASGWSIGIMVPEEEILADLRVMSQRVLLIGLAGFGLLFAAVVAVSTGITRPIRSLARQAREIAKGNLDLPLLAVHSRDEVGALSHSFEDMRVALKEYVANLAATTAAKERIESELKIAQSIQRSFLPKHFPPFPDKTEFDLYAELHAAKEVGGDLYDFFLLDSRHLFFAVGDVSGKGVPAALFMAVTKTLMKGLAEQHLTPCEVLRKVNGELYVDNDQMMFVTVFCGILDLETGRVDYTNAGHLPPVLLRGDGAVSWVDLPPGVLLGISEDPVYETRTLTLGPQDTLLLYTDGVTEAMNAAKELLGDDWLLSFAQTQPGANPKDLVENLLAAVQRFEGGEPQSDDVTALALQYRKRV